MANPSIEPKGWYSRGYLPHLDTPDKLQFVTIHLADSMPRDAVQRMLGDLKRNDPERRRRIERYLDAGHGACWLHRLEVAELVESALLYFDGERYRLMHWVIMP